MIKALIFDFDGLILDSELPDFESWQEVYRGYGCELDVRDWGQIVGGNGATDFDPHTNLEKLSGKVLDREDIWINRRKRYLEQLYSQPVLPGVLDMLFAAEELGLKRGVASSSPENWVRGHLARLGLYQYFDAITTGDEVAKLKPAPDIYLLALQKLGVQAGEAIVLEDSPNGVTAALAAGIFAVAIPNEVTAQLGVEHADLVLDSMADISLAELIQKVKVR